MVRTTYEYSYLRDVRSLRVTRQVLEERMLPGVAIAIASSAAEPLGDGPMGDQSPCGWLLAHRDAGDALTDQIALAEANHALFTTADLRCLKAAGVHKRVVEGARDGNTAELQAARREVALAGRVQFEFLSVVIAPAKRDGTRWDGLPGENRVPPEAIAALMVVAMPIGGGILATVDAQELIAQIGTLGLQGTAAPDVFGYAEVRGPNAPPQWTGARLSLLPPTAPGQDSFYTVFPGSPSFTGIRMEEGDVVRVTLYDQDLMNPDPIGVFDLTRTDVDAALQHDGAVFLSVADRSQGGVLLLQVAVRAAETPTPGVVGQFFREQ